MGTVNPQPFSKADKYSILPALNIECFLCQDIIQESFATERFFFFYTRYTIAKLQSISWSEFCYCYEQLPDPSTSIYTSNN